MSSDSGETTLVRTIGRYRAFDELGRGAMGVVYRGFDPIIGRTVALKTLSIDTGDAQAKEFRERLYREAAAAGALSHPNIVTIFDIIEDGATTAVAMEFIEGRSLAAIITERAPLPLDLAVDILDQVCSALDFAGSQGIVHRDIKPANILVTSGGRAKVTDFGVARLALSTMTQAGTVLGSPSYMSPEQVRGLSLDGRSDLFSAAVVFFEMITRERPFAGNDIATTMYRIAHEPPTPPGHFNAAIGPEVAEVLDRAFAKNPADRFQTGADFVAELRAVASLGSRSGTSAALAAMATAPPPVPPVVAPSASAAGTTVASPGPSTPAMLPIPVTGSATPAVIGGDGRTLAPIPGMGKAADVPPADPAGLTPALPAIPVTPSGGPAGAPRPLVAAGKKHRPALVALLGAGATLFVVIAIAGMLWLRGGADVTVPTVEPPHASPPVELPAPGPEPASVPPDRAAAPVAAGPFSQDRAPDAASSQAGPAASLRRAPGSAQTRAGARISAPQPTVPTAPLETPQPSSQPSSATRPSGRVYRATEVDARPRVLKQVPPVYPEDARRQNVQDTVVLQVLVGPAGRADDIQVLRGSRKAPSLDGAAVAAVRQWVFDPARKNGKPVACWYNVGVPFEPPR